MALVLPPRTLTAEQFSRLSESFDYRQELLEGELVLSPTAKFAHTAALDKVEAALKWQFPEMRVVREAGWLLRSGNVESVPGPDLMLVREDDYQRAAGAGGYFEARPLLVIEIVSPSERRSRRMQKIELYLKANVPAVVEIHYEKRFAMIYRPDVEATEMVRGSLTEPFLFSLEQL